MTSIEFIVPCVPIAQPRQRHRIVHAGGKSFASNYTPKDDPVNAFKAAVQVAAAASYSGPPLAVPLIVDFTFLMPRPQALIWKTKPMPRCPCATKKNDRDNLMKSVQDALNGLLWADDGLIYDGRTTKLYAAGDEQPHVIIRVQSAA